MFKWFASLESVSNRYFENDDENVNIGFILETIASRD